MKKLMIICIVIMLLVGCKVPDEENKVRTSAGISSDSGG